MKLILHIGHEKTGSKSIQKYLSQTNFYGRASVLKTNDLNCHELAVAFSDDKELDYFDLTGKIVSHSFLEKWADGVKAKFQKDMLACISGEGGCAIISSEHFSTRVTSGKAISELHDYLKTAFHEIEVHLFLRKHEDLIKSLYSTALENGYDLDADSFEEFITQNRRYLDYSSLITRWNEAFEANVHVHHYEPATDSVNTLLKALGIQCRADDAPSYRLNRSIPTKIQYVLLALNRVLPTYINGRPVKRNMIAHIIRRMIVRACQHLPAERSITNIRCDPRSPYNSQWEEISHKYFEKKFINDDNRPS